MKKVLVGMSGGVDSSTSAALLLEKGYEVVGATLKLTDNADESFIDDAKKVAAKLGIKHVVLDFREQFARQVMDYFAGEYLAGRTPNPCAMCNFKIKFGLMLDYAESIGCDYLATGHYAKIVHDEKRGKWLLKATDSKKDQSYFLYKLTQSQLSRAIFPLAEFEKTKVREIAQGFDLPVAHKSESQDICFVKGETHYEFIQRYKNVKPESGAFLSENGKILGTHKGIINYTVGQRRHLGVALGEHAYVKKINAGENTIILSGKQEGKTTHIFVSGVNLISVDEIPQSGLKAWAKVRSRATPALCKVFPGEKLKVVFDEPIYFPAAGQSVVFYDGEGYVIGGGTIETDI